MTSSPFSTPITLTTPPYTFILSEATPADIPAFCNIFYTAHEANPFLVAAYGNSSREEQIAADIARWELDWPRPGRRFYKAVDAATSETVAVAKWVFPHTPAPPPAKVPNIPIPEGTNVGLVQAFFGQLYVNREKWIKPEDMYHMNLLAVLPKYQRLGIGKTMLATVLKEVDKEGRQVFVEGTPEGASLYRKFGWQECDDRFTFDLAKFGAGQDVLETTLLLMRQPGAGGPGL